KYAARNRSNSKRGDFQLGDSTFNRNWVAAPATSEGDDGLGPTFNARSCSGCHASNGRGSAPDEGDEFIGLVLRLSVPGEGPHGAPKPEPTYGHQFQPQGIFGVSGEGTPAVHY